MSDFAAAAAAAGSNGSALVGAICGPVRINYRKTFGRDLSAAEFTAASGDAERSRCIVQKDDDLHQAIQQMSSLGAEVLLVTQGASESVSVSDIVGVVTKTDISENVSSKSALMARDRTLSKAPTPKLASMPSMGATIAASRWKRKALGAGSGGSGGGATDATMSSSNNNASASPPPSSPKRDPRPKMPAAGDADASVEIQQFGSE
jgi:hypothetical protein